MNYIDPMTSEAYNGVAHSTTIKLQRLADALEVDVKQNCIACIDARIARARKLLADLEREYEDFIR